MIPKIIHYCWFGGAPKSKLIKKCIKSWLKYCGDYKIIEWNETNFDINTTPLFVRQAYQHKKWAFVTDYVRLKVVYENGGLYFDTDVELLKNPDDFLQNEAFFGFNENNRIATGLVMGANKNCKLLADLMDNYLNDSVLKILNKRNDGVSASIYTANISENLQLDLEKHNSQYQPINIQRFNKSHDRFLIIDKDVYLIGGSIKDLGKKVSTFIKLSIQKEEFLQHVKIP